MARQHMQIVDISVYKLVTLGDHGTLRLALLTECQAHELEDTMLLVPEDINIFLASLHEAIDGIIGWLHADARFVDLAPKESLSDHQPSRRLLVRMKKGIITIRHPLVRPEDDHASSVTPPNLKRWFDQGHDDKGRPVVMLNTRSDYETAVDTFKNVIEYNLKRFAGFPPAIAMHKNDFAGKTVVSFCAGGTRCEKAAIHMQEAGVERVYRLKGGILEYFEEVGGAHYDGDCFMLDHRIAPSAELQPAGPKRCFAYRVVVMPEEQQSAEYIPGQHCPRCAGNQTHATA